MMSLSEFRLTAVSRFTGRRVEVVDPFASAAGGKPSMPAPKRPV